MMAIMMSGKQTVDMNLLTLLLWSTSQGECSIICQTTSSQNWLASQKRNKQMNKLSNYL